MVVFALIWLALSLLLAYIGKNRKLGFWGYLIISIIFSPLVAVVALLASDPRKKLETKAS